MTRYYCILSLLFSNYANFYKKKKNYNFFESTNCDFMVLDSIAEGTTKKNA